MTSLSLHVTVARWLANQAPSLKPVLFINPELVIGNQCPVLCINGIGCVLDSPVGNVAAFSIRYVKKNDSDLFYFSDGAYRVFLCSSV